MRPADASPRRCREEYTAGGWEGSTEQRRSPARRPGSTGSLGPAGGVAQEVRAITLFRWPPPAYPPKGPPTLVWKSDLSAVRKTRRHAVGHVTAAAIECEFVAGRHGLAVGEGARALSLCGERPTYPAHELNAAGAPQLNCLEDGGARIHSAWHTWRVSTAPAASVAWKEHPRSALPQSCGAVQYALRSATRRLRWRLRRQRSGCVVVLCGWGLRCCSYLLGVRFGPGFG